MLSLARRAARNPDFVRGVLLVDGARCSVEDIDRTWRPFFVYRDEREEIVRSPEWMLRDFETLGRLEGDCDDIATFVAAVALVCGFTVRVTAIRYTATVMHFEHVFTEVLDGLTWRVIDLTVPVGSTMYAYEVMEEYA